MGRGPRGGTRAVLVVLALAFGGCSGAAGVTDVAARPSASEVSMAASDCTPGDDRTCNHNPMISSLHGRCQRDGWCECRAEFLKSPETGRCL